VIVAHEWQNTDYKIQIVEYRPLFVDLKSQDFVPSFVDLKMLRFCTALKESPLIILRLKFSRMG